MLLCDFIQFGSLLLDAGYVYVVAHAHCSTNSGTKCVHVWRFKEPLQGRRIGGYILRQTFEIFSTQFDPNVDALSFKTRVDTRSKTTAGAQDFLICGEEKNSEFRHF
jgi:hypothetical protein